MKKKLLVKITFGANIPGWPHFRYWPPAVTVKDWDHGLSLQLPCAWSCGRGCLRMDQYIPDIACRTENSVVTMRTLRVTAGTNGYCLVGPISGWKLAQRRDSWSGLPLPCQGSVQQTTEAVVQPGGTAMQQWGTACQHWLHSRGVHANPRWLLCQEQVEGPSLPELSCVHLLLLIHNHCPTRVLCPGCWSGFAHAFP